jgi:thymidylate synthase
MYTIEGSTFAEAYGYVLEDVMNIPDYETAPRGLRIREMIGAHIKIYDPTYNLFKNEVRSIPMGYLADELCLYFSGTADPDKFAQASKFWGTIEENGQINSAYGNLIFSMEDTPDQQSQWQWAVDSLVSDNDSRQAIMHFNRPSHQYSGNKDFPCTVSCQWFIREGELQLITYMRSNDVFFGMTFDIPFFMTMMQVMRNALEARGVKVVIGSYNHFAGSLHAYEKDFETIGEMLKYEFEDDSAPQVDVCPIFHPDLDAIIEGQEIGTNSRFIEWLNENSTFGKNK